ncbi:MAG TPA: potassium channel protein [Paludibacter sp.]|nr:potassium channel protein [Paludibacter sp.]
MKSKSKLRNLVFKELLIPLVALILIFAVGFAGFIVIEGFSPLKSLYLIVMTFATVGYGDVVPVSDAGRMLAAGIVIAEFTVGLYALGRISTFIVEGEFSKLLKVRKMNRTLESMKDHYIVCGYGKTGKHVLEELLEKGLGVVMIESNPERNERLREVYDKKFIHLDADATDDAVLMQAGIMRAKFLISVLSSDAENLFVTLSAKDLNRDIKVITRVAEGNTPDKFKKAGADFIVSPIEIATDRIISIATSSTDFFSFVEFAEAKAELKEYKFGLIEINQGSDLVNKSFRDANIPARTNLVVIGRYSATSELQVNPKADDHILLGDKLLVFGNNSQIESFREIARDAK